MCCDSGNKDFFIELPDYGGKVSKSQLWTLKPHFCKKSFMVKKKVCVRQALVRLPFVVRTLCVCRCVCCASVCVYCVRFVL